jgi:hypothetical protein
VRRCIKGSYATGEGYNSQIVLHGFFLVVTWRTGHRWMEQHVPVLLLFCCWCEFLL